MKYGRRALPAVALAAALTAAPAQAVLVPDGGFETPADGTGVVEYGQGGMMGDWLIGPGNVDHVGSSLWTPSEGALTVDLNASDIGGLSQHVATTPGTAYQVHYALAGNFYGPPAVKRLKVTFGSSRMNAGFDTTGKTAANTGWICPVSPVTATSSDTVLGFVSTTTNPGSNNWYGPVVDDVRVLGASDVAVFKVAPQALGQGAARAVTIYGSNFAAGASVSVGGTGITASAVKVVDPSRLSVKLTVAPNAPLEARDVTVSGATSDTCGKSLMVNPGPAPTSVSPSSAAHGTTGDVHVLGSNFVTGAKVAFNAGGITVNSVTFNNSGDLTANITISPGAAIRPRTVTVTNPDSGRGLCVRCFMVT